MYIDNLELIKGAAQVITFTVYQGGATNHAVFDGTAIPQDVAGWTFEWHLHDHFEAAGAAEVVEKTTADGIAITGTYNADPALNTQRVVVSLETTDWTNVAGGQYDHGFWRTNAGLENALCTGKVIVLSVP